MKRLWAFLKQNWIKVSVQTWFAFLVTFIIANVIVVGSSFLKWHGYDTERFDDILTHMNGSLFDIFIMGLLVSVILTAQEKKKNTQRWMEEIDDFRYWKEQESSYRIAGNIKRLNMHGISKINLFKCNLDGSYLENINLNSSGLFETRLSNSFLKGANFQKATCIMADFSNSILYKADFRHADLSGTIFNNSDLSYADFNGAKGLTAEQLSQSSSLWNAKFDNYTFAKIESICSKQLKAASCRCSEELWEPQNNAS